MSYRTEIAAELRAEMAVKKYTVTQLCLDTGFSRTRLSTRLSGRSPFDTDELEVVAETLGVTVPQLWSRATARAAA